MHVSPSNSFWSQVSSWHRHRMGWRQGHGAGHGHSAGHGHEAGPASVTRLRAIERTQSSDIRLQIKTDEGDTVTLTVHAGTDALSLTYRNRTRGEGGPSKTAVDLTSLSASNSFEIQVEGSLSEEELAAIDALAARVKGAVASFLRDGSSLAMSLAGVGADPALEPLAGFELGVSRTQTLEAVWMRMREWVARDREVGHQQLAPAAEPLDMQPVVTSTDA